MHEAVFILIHVVIFVDAIDRPLSLNLLSFHIAILGSLCVTLWFISLPTSPILYAAVVILGAFQLVKERVKSPLNISCKSYVLCEKTAEHVVRRYI